MPKKKSPIQGDMRISKNGKAYYAVVGANGKFISRSTVGVDKFIVGDGKKVFIGQGKTGSKRETQNKDFAKRLKELQEAYNYRQNHTPTKLFDLDADTELRTHKPYSEQPTTTIWDTDPYNPEEDIKRVTMNKSPKKEISQHLIGKDSSGQPIYAPDFQFSENLKNRYGISRKEQRHYYEILNKANIVLGYSIRDTQGEIGYLFSTNFNSLTPEKLLSRLEAAEKILKPSQKAMKKIQEEYEKTDKHKDFFKFSAPYLAQYHITKVSIQYKKDFLENYKQFFREKDYNRLKEAIEPLPPRVFTKILKTVGLDYLAYYLQSQITTESYDSALSDIDVLIDSIEKYKRAEL